MKRGWITWDPDELPPAVFQRRLAEAAHLLALRGLPALLVYTDVWRSNHARYFANFMPYWSRSLLVLPRDAAPVLLCALSPRVYPWISSTSILEDIRSGPLHQSLLKLCAERGWMKIGVLDFASLPHDLHTQLCSSGVQVEDVPSGELPRPALDEWEIGMRRRAVLLARETLARELPAGAGARDWELAGRLERVLRSGGAEDVVILVSHGNSAPRPAAGALLGKTYSVTLALEYRGHWVRISRPHAPRPQVETLRQKFQGALRNLAAAADARFENLAGPSPCESCHPSELAAGSIFALHVESAADHRRLFYGDTCIWRNGAAEPL